MLRRLANVFYLPLLVTNWLSSKFEAAQKSMSRSDGTWWFRPQDARLDFTATDRETILEKSRGFERNNPIANRLADIFEQYTVGPNGLQIIPASTDEDWNQRHTRSWQRWQNYCDLTSLFNFATLQSLVARTWFFDGEVFILKTYGQETIRAAGRPSRYPRIQLIEAQRVKTPPDWVDKEGVQIIDGVEIDITPGRKGRPIGYHVRDLTADGKETYTRYDAAQIIHVFEPHRPGEYRGRPFLTPVLNILHDLDDLHKFEMGAAKEAGKVANIVETATGEMPSTADIVRDRVSRTTQDGSGNNVTQERTTFLQKIFGPSTYALKKGEKFSQFKSERPSVTTQAYWDYLTAQVCAGVGISKLLVFPYSVQGTVTRADLDIAAGFFRSRSGLLAWAFKQIYLWFTEWAVLNERESSDPPGAGMDGDKSYRECSYRAPRSVNVDVGRNSQAMLAELKAGTRTYDSVYSELGLDWRAELRQRAKEAKFIHQLAKEMSSDGDAITPGEIADLVGDAIQKQAQADAAANPPQPLEQAA